MIIQTVYSLENENESYFETPSPNWTWGCRFSLNYFKNMVIKTGWEIIDIQTNELLGNENLQDRGSVYAILKPRV